MKRRRLVLFALLGVVAGYLVLRWREARMLAGSTGAPADVPTAPGYPAGTVVGADLSAQAPDSTWEQQQASSAGLLPTSYPFLQAPVGLDGGLGDLAIDTSSGDAGFGLDDLGDLSAGSSGTVPAPVPLNLSQVFYVGGIQPSGSDQSGKPRTAAMEVGRTTKGGGVATAQHGTARKHSAHEKATVQHTPTPSHHKKKKPSKRKPAKNLHSIGSLPSLPNL